MPCVSIANTSLAVTSRGPLSPGPVSVCVPLLQAARATTDNQRIHAARFIAAILSVNGARCKRTVHG